MDMNIIGWIFIGLLAGGISGWFVGTKSVQGCLPTIVVGILGAIIGGFLARGVGNDPVQGFLGALVFGVLRSSEWGWIKPKSGGTSWWGLSPTIWLVLAGAFVLWLFLQWQGHLERRGKEPLVRPVLFQNKQLLGGLTMFFFQSLVQAGLFFVVPLYLSVHLGLSALATGARLTPLSLTLLAAAIGIPRLRPQANPRRVVRLGLLALLLGTVILLGALAVGLGVGPVPIGAGPIAESALSHLPFLHVRSPLTAPEEAILWQLRAPRVVLGALVGGMLAVATLMLLAPRYGDSAPSRNSL